MFTEQSKNSESSATRSMPVSFAGSIRLLEAGVRARAADLRRSLARRDAHQAWSCFRRLHALLSAHLSWEADDLPALMGTPDLIDLPGGTRTLGAWHDLLIDALSDIASALSGPTLAHTNALVRVDHDVARLIALAEDYCTDVSANLYRALDRDAEAHDAEPIRRRALEVWARRTSS